MTEETKITHPTREQTKRRREWKEPNELEVPQELTERLRSQGYGTRWIRVLVNGKDDPVNVMTRLREGYEFVKKSEAPEWPDAPSYLHGSHGDLIVIGDLALAKLPLEISQDRTRKMRAKVQALSDAVDRQLYEHAAMNRMLPIRNESSSRVSRGRKAVLDTEDE